MCSDINPPRRVKYMNLINLHRHRYSFQFVHTVYHIRIALNNAGHGFRIMQTGLSVFFLNLQKLLLIFFQHGFNL